MRAAAIALVLLAALVCGIVLCAHGLTPAWGAP